MQESEPGLVMMGDWGHWWGWGTGGVGGPLVEMLGTSRGAGHGSRRPTWGFFSLPQPGCFPRRVSARCSAWPPLPAAYEDHI